LPFGSEFGNNGLEEEVMLWMGEVWRRVVVRSIGDIRFVSPTLILIFIMAVSCYSDDSMCSHDYTNKLFTLLINKGFKPDDSVIDKYIDYPTFMQRSEYLYRLINDHNINTNNTNIASSSNLYYNCETKLATALALLFNHFDDKAVSIYLRNINFVCPNTNIHISAEAIKRAGAQFVDSIMNYVIHTENEEEIGMAGDLLYEILDPHHVHKLIENNKDLLSKDKYISLSVIRKNM
jgi:hypothetical protein